MSCVAEIHDGHVDDGNDIAIPIDEGLRISISDGVHDEIPTIDASDVGEQLPEEALTQATKSNYASLVWALLLEAHTREPSHGRDFCQQLDQDAESQHDKEMKTILDFSRKDIENWDLEGQFPIAEDPNSSAHQADHGGPDLVVRKLPRSIQLAFRRSVLDTLAIYVFSSSAISAICLLCIDLQPTLQHLEHSSSPLTVAAASGFLVCASMCALYSHRFQAPINFAALALLTLSEIVFTVAVGMTFDPYAVVVASALLSCGVLAFRVLACRSVFANDPRKLPCLGSTALLSTTALGGVTIPLNVYLGPVVTHTSTPVFIASLGLVALVMPWIALVLEVLEHTMAPEAHATAIVFFQADIVVVAILVPAQLLRKLSCQVARLRNLQTSTQSKTQAWRKFNPANHVVPSFWPDDLTPTALPKYCGPAPPTPLQRTQWIPGRELLARNTHVPSDTIRVATRVAEGTCNADIGHEFGSPRRRSSVTS